MNIYDYDWWQVLIFIIGLELAAAFMAYILMNMRAGKYFKGRWRKNASYSRSVRYRRKL